jgi:hypothetical protein
MSEQESFIEPIVLSHEMFILDANLIRGLDQSRMNEITNNLINDLIEELGMAKLGPLGIYNATYYNEPYQRTLFH